ncbi:hypothetical protein LXL04_020519 [Taraxacum kok-saghyz]
MSQTPVMIVESQPSPFPTFSSPISTPVSEPSGSSSPIPTESKVITESEKEVSEPSDSSSPMPTESKVITESEKKRTTRAGKAKRVLFVDANRDPLLDINPTKRERYQD